MSAPRPPEAVEARGERAAPAARTWTVLELLRWTTEHFAGRGIETPRLDAECLLAHALASDRLRLYLDYEKPVCDAERARFRALVRRRGEERVPVAQLTGEREFWSLPLFVDAGVLVPRPETETLVEAALEGRPEAGGAPRVLDVGTGSGAIALALAREWPGAHITATDVSAEALAVARRNAERHGCAERVRLLQGDLFEPVAGERFDLVISNPPYLAEAERPGLAPELAHEPAGALFAGPTGREVQERLVDGAAAMLRPGGSLVLEIAPDQAEAICDRLGRVGFEDIRVRRDLGDRPRAVCARGGEG